MLTFLFFHFKKIIFEITLHFILAKETMIISMYSKMILKSFNKVFGLNAFCILVGYLMMNISNAQTTPALSWGSTINNGSFSFSYGNAITTDSDGNIIVVGTFSGIMDADPRAGVSYLYATSYSEDLYIEKLSSTGALIWVKHIKSSGTTSSVTGVAVKTDISGNVYITGTYSGSADFDPGTGISNLNNAGFKDIFILKLNISGNFLWVKQIGSGNDEFSRDITVDASGNVFTVGLFSNGGNVDFDPGAGVFNAISNGSRDLFIQKLAPNGDFIWVKTLGGTNNDEAHAIAIDGTGNLFITGFFMATADMDPNGTVSNLTSNGASDIFVLKLTNGGSFSWAKSMGGTLNSEEGESIKVDAGGNVYIGGRFSGASVDFDPNIEPPICFLV